MLIQLRARPFADRITVLSGDFFETAFGSDYDAMISTSALHHFTPEDKVRLYRRVYDALRPGGLFLNADKTAPDAAAQEEDFRQYAENPHRWPHMDTPLTVEAECDVLLQAGFSDISASPLPNDKYFLFRAVKL